MRRLRLAGASVGLLWLCGCAADAAECAALAAGSLAEVVTDSSGRRVIRSAEGVEFVANQDGTVEVRGTDGKRFVVTRDGSVATTEREVRVVTSSGERVVSAETVAAAAAAAPSTARAAVNDVADPASDGDDDDDGGKTVICHVPPGNPANQHTLSVGSSAVDAHLGHGDYTGECDPDRVQAKSTGKDNGKKGKK